MITMNMPKSKYFILIFTVIFFLAGCDSTSKIVVSKKQNNGYLIEILADSSWEYSQSVYYRISKGDKCIIHPTFVEFFGDPQNIHINFAEGLFFGTELHRPEIVVFIHRIKDNASWPESKKWADQLLSELRIAKNNMKLQLSSRVDY